jgi:hypothetical protein
MTWKCRPIWYAVILASCLCGYLALRALWGGRSTQLGPFSNAQEISSAITQLPEIAGQGVRSAGVDWQYYTIVAKRMKGTHPDIIKSAFRQLAALRGPQRSAIDIRVMLLLRVCFECPSGRMPKDVRGGWFSYSARDAHRTIDDMNWPVRQRLGLFYVEDSLDGYLGPPYDSAAEFNWMLANCKWRDL